MVWRSQLHLQGIWRYLPEERLPWTKMTTNTEDDIIFAAEIVTNQEAMEKDLNIASQYVKCIELLNYKGLSIFVSLIVFASPS